MDVRQSHTCAALGDRRQQFLGGKFGSEFARVERLRCGEQRRNDVLRRIAFPQAWYRISLMLVAVMHMDGRSMAMFVVLVVEIRVHVQQTGVDLDGDNASDEQGGKPATHRMEST